MDWRFEQSGPHSGVVNMQIDEEMARALLRSEGGPVVRVYGWNPPALSIGWNQSFDEIDVAKASAADIDVVRRPTGGRAVLHSEEVTYAVVMALESGSVNFVYREISQALVAGLRYLGIDAVLEQAQPLSSFHNGSSSGVACFNSSARHEIKVQGRKLVGSAQRRFHRSDGSEVVLQHGSILLGPDHKRITEFLNFEGERDRFVLARELEERTIDLRTIVGTSVEFTDVANSIKRGFEAAWGVEFSSQRASDYQCNYLNLNNYGKRG